jgi:hypothetical protein
VAAKACGLFPRETLWSNPGNLDMTDTMKPKSKGPLAFLSSSIQKVRGQLSPAQREQLMHFQALHLRGVQHLLFRSVIGSNLKALAVVNRSDKWGSHWYAQHYEQYFAPLRHKRLNILEIGIGGYDDPKRGGASLRMWRTYFPSSNIYGIDICDKSLHDEPRIKTFKGSQVDEPFLDHVMQEIGHVDIIIDDGSHLNEHVIRTFELLFPRLAPNGLYVVEDTQTSYWREYGGSSDNLNQPDTSMSLFKKLTDGLNYCEFEKEGYEPTYFDKHIIAMHFYHNMVFIQKGRNDEKSNMK